MLFMSVINIGAIRDCLLSAMLMELLHVNRTALNNVETNIPKQLNNLQYISIRGWRAAIWSNLRRLCRRVYDDSLDTAISIAQWWIRRYPIDVRRKEIESSKTDDIAKNRGSNSLVCHSWQNIEAKNQYATEKWSDLSSTVSMQKQLWTDTYSPTR